MSVSKRTRCQSCGMVKHPYVYTTPYNILCMSCFKADRDTRGELVRQLPDVKAVKPPHGYHLFENEYFRSESQGKTFCDLLFEMHQGSVN